MITNEALTCSFIIAVSGVTTNMIEAHNPHISLKTKLLSCQLADSSRCYVESPSTVKTD